MKALTPLKKYRFLCILAPVLKLFECATELLSPMLVRYMIDVGIRNSDLRYTLTLGAIMVGAALLGFAFTMIAQWLAAKVAASYCHDLRNELYAHTLALSESQKERFSKQKILTILGSDSLAMQNGVMMFLRLVFRPPFLLIGASIISFTMNVYAGLIFSGVVLLCAAVLIAVVFISPKHYVSVQQSVDEINAVSSSALKGARPIRAFGQQERERERFEGAIEDYRKKNVRIGIYTSAVLPLAFCFINLGMVLVVYLGGFGVSDGFMTTGQIVSLISYLSMALMAIIMFSRMIASINRATASKRRIDSYFALTPDIQDKDGEVPVRKDAPLFEMKDVAYSYSGDEHYAIEGIDLSIEPGESIGFIGGTGSGKSTIISLLERTREPSKGSILYRGKDYSEFPRDVLHQDVSSILQKPSIFKGTIRSNLLLGKADATNEEMWGALEEALAASFVSAFPEGLDHPVSEGGVNLSGGQRQRLLLARAFLKKSSLLILDDSMSALDYLSESKVRESLKNRKEQAKIIVSQRVSSLRDCDRIYVMDKGRILACGKHEDLLRNCEIYREIDSYQRSAK